MSIGTRTAFFSFVLVALLSLAAVASAQTQEAPAEQQPSSVQGELVAVDLEAKTIEVMVGEKEMQFAYTDATEVVGAQEGIAGLAALEKAQVTVHFVEADGQQTATRIEVSQAAESPSQQ